MLGNRWFSEFNKIWPLPDNYITIDVETSGFSPVKNLLCTFGWCVVTNNHMVNSGEIVLNWFAHPTVNADGLIEELGRVETSMTSRGKAFHHTPQYLRERGVDPIQGLESIHNLLQFARHSRVPLIGFNAYAFDAEFIQAHLYDFLNISYLIGDNEMYDIGICEKAAQLHPDDEPLPLPHETLRDWSFRIGGLRRAGIYWALDGYCENKYRLTQQLQLDSGDFHRSEFDAVYLHHLFQAQRALVRGHE